MKYEHTQTGYLMIIVLSVITVFYTIVLVQTDFDPTLFLIMIIIIFIVVSFKSLNVTIGRQYLRIKFGYGLFRKKFNLEDIVSSKIVKNQWYYGWGIRYWPFRPMWIFNVSGFDAVEIKMKSGKIYRIGTDDPKGLELVLKKQELTISLFKL